MKIPGTYKKLVEFVQEVTAACTVSRKARINQAQYWTKYYYNATVDNSSAPYNRCYPHIDKLSSYLYSPSDNRWSIEFERDYDKPWIERASTAANYLGKKLKNCGAPLQFSAGTDWALIKGKTLGKWIWGPAGLEPHLIQPELFGVYREDRDTLEEQEAFLHSSWYLPEEIERLLIGEPDKDKMMTKILAASSHDDGENGEREMLHQIIMGGTNPVTTTAPDNPAKGMVSTLGAPVPSLAPELMAKLVRMDELWIMDDDREDFTTIRSVAGTDVILEGRYQHRNLMSADGGDEFFKGVHPFWEMTANPTPGYFWGRSELALIQQLQDMLNNRVQDVDILLGLRARPPFFGAGMSGLTTEKLRAQWMRGGYISDQNPTAKLQSLAPDMPPDALQQVEAVMSYMDDVGGFTPILSGQGDQGVRAGVHAQSLVRTSSPRLKDRALMLEGQCEDMGSTAFKILQAKNAKVFVSQAHEQFLLSQIPEDYRVVADTHSGSPAFQEDARNLAFALYKAGAIGPDDLIALTQPPSSDTLIAHARERMAAEAKFQQEHPELAAKGKKSR